MKIETIQAQFDIGDLVTAYYRDVSDEIHTFHCVIADYEGGCMIVTPYMAPKAPKAISQLANVRIPLLADFLFDIR